MFKRKIKGVSILLIIGFLFNGCAKRENGNNLNDDYEKVNTINILDWNDKKINKYIGKNDDGINIDAVVYVYSNKLYTGSVFKSMPTVEDVEKVVLDGNKMVEEHTEYDLFDDNNKINEKKIDTYYALYEENNDELKAMFSNSEMEGSIVFSDYKKYHFEFDDKKATYLDASNYDMVHYENQILDALYMNVKPFKFYEGIENNKKIDEIRFINMLDGVPFLNSDLGLDYTTIRKVDSNIAEIKYAPNVEFVNENNSVNQILSPEAIIEIINNEYINGNISVANDWVIDRILLGYIETKDENVIPVWIFTSNFLGDDVVTYVFDAVTGKIVFDIGRGDTE